MKRANIAIAIIAYKDVMRFQRLLNSVKNAYYDSERVDLIISIDRSETLDVVKAAESFEWEHGKKTVRTFAERQGLKKHILSCGDYLEEYEALFVLEDDLIVSPQFFRYGISCIEKYRNDSRIAGISLYSPQWNQNANFPFDAQKSEFSVFFLQCAQSWGQIWLKGQWEEFKNWYKENDDYFSGKEKDYVPHHLYTWGENSWLKYHIAYCLEKKKYFVCPYFSYSSTFTEKGEHIETQITRFHTSLMIEKEDTWRLPEISENGIRYDSFWENETIKESISRRLGKKICFDLYGKKRFFEKCDILISTQILPYRVIKEYGIQLRPVELNPFFEVDGKGIFVYDLHEKAEPEKKERKKQICRLWNYFMKERFLMLNEILPVGREKAASLVGTVFGRKHS